MTQLQMQEDIMQNKTKLPKCSECGEPIQDDSYFEVGGDYYCEECMDNHRVMNF